MIRAIQAPVAARGKAPAHLSVLRIRVKPGYYVRATRFLAAGMVLVAFSYTYAAWWMAILVGFLGLILGAFDLVNAGRRRIEVTSEGIRVEDGFGFGIPKSEFMRFSDVKRIDAGYGPKTLRDSVVFLEAPGRSIAIWHTHFRLSDTRQVLRQILAANPRIEVTERGRRYLR